MPKKSKTPRKQLNIGLTPEQYALVQEAAEAEDITVTEFCRDAILEAATSVEPQLETGHEGPAMPAWLVAFLLFLRNGRTHKQA